MKQEYRKETCLDEEKQLSKMQSENDIGLLHCKCGISYHKDMGYFERTKDMVFALERKKIRKKIKQVPVIRYMNKTE